MSETGMRKLASSNHGGGVRGDTMRRRSSMFEGRFGRMFRNLPPASWPEDALHALGAAMLVPPEATDATPRLPKAAPETDAILQDDEENSGIAAGYTYLGQFIDHDITFDPASSLQQQNDPNGLMDFRTPRLDLDSVYGRGPDDQPYMYDGKRFRLGRPLLRCWNWTSPVPAATCRLPEFSEATPASPPLTVDQLQAKPVDPVRNPANLAARNLLRGMAMELPSGQAVADAMGVPRVPDEQLFVGKAITGELANDPKLVDIDPSSRTTRRSGTTCWRKRSTNGCFAPPGPAARAMRSRSGSARWASGSSPKR